MSNAQRRSGRPVSPEPIVRLGSDFEASWPGASALATECVLNLGWLSERLLDYGEAVVKGHGLTSLAAFNVLTIIDGANEPLAPSTVAERMIVTRATMTRTLRSLERRGLVRRAVHPRDRRKILIDLTAEGRRRLARILPELHLAERRWMDCLTVREQRSLLRMVARIQAARPASPGGSVPRPLGLS